MATPPTFIGEFETAWNVSTTPKTTASITAVANDVLVAIAVNEGYGDYTGSNDDWLADLVPSGGSLTWTQRQEVIVNDYTYATIYTAVVDSDKSMTVTFTRTGTVGSNALVLWWGGNVLQFRGSDGVGASNKTNVASGGPSLALTTTVDNSAVVSVSGDFAAVDGASRTWRTVNGITPTSGNSLEVSYFRDASHYAVYGAYWSDVGAAGSKTVGLSAPSTQKYSICAVEVKGAAGGRASKNTRAAPLGVEAGMGWRMTG